MGIVWQLPPRDDPPRDEDRFVHRNGGVCLNPHDLSISTKHNASWLNPIDFYEEFPFSAIPSRKYKSMYIYILYIYTRTTTSKEIEKPGWFFGLLKNLYVQISLDSARANGRLRSLGLLLFENRLLIKKDLGPILATAACSTTVTIGGNRAARIFGAKKPMWETDKNLTDPSKWVFSAILVGILGLKAFLRSHVDDHVAWYSSGVCLCVCFRGYI